MSKAPRNTTQRDRDRAAIRRHRPPCGICEGEIDWSLRWPDPMSYVVDHVVPLAKGGLDVLENKQASHAACNRAKSDKLAEELGPRTFVTERTW